MDFAGGAVGDGELCALAQDAREFWQGSGTPGRGRLERGRGELDEGCGAFEHRGQAPRSGQVDAVPAWQGGPSRPCGGPHCWGSRMGLPLGRCIRARFSPLGLHRPLHRASALTSGFSLKSTYILSGISMPSMAMPWETVVLTKALSARRMERRSSFVSLAMGWSW